MLGPQQKEIVSACVPSMLQISQNKVSMAVKASKPERGPPHESCEANVSSRFQRAVVKRIPRRGETHPARTPSN